MIKDPKALPTHWYRQHNTSILNHEDIVAEITLHLRSLGPYFSMVDVVKFVSTPAMQSHLNHSCPLSENAATDWLKQHGFSFKNNPKGQYADGHEWQDVLNYLHKKFLLCMAELNSAFWQWDQDGQEELPVENTSTTEPHTIFWCHNKSIFYAHDCHKLQWVHKGETATPYAKGEGHSLMVTDFMSADYSWLCSHDGYIHM
jgi:hypothetical protein